MQQLLTLKTLNSSVALLKQFMEMHFELHKEQRHAPSTVASLLTMVTTKVEVLFTQKLAHLFIQTTK